MTHRTHTKIVNNNNNWFLYSAFLVWDTTQSALQCIITPVTGFNINPALIVHLLNSPGSILARCYFRGAHMPHHATITFESYRVPIYTPGWRAAMWIKCLAEGQKVPGIVLTGIEHGTLWSRVKGSIQYTTAPPLLCDYWTKSDGDFDKMQMISHSFKILKHS